MPQPPAELGILNYIASGLFFLLASFNLINCMKDASSLTNTLSATLPIYLLAIFCFLLKGKYILSIAFLCVALQSTIYNNNIDNYSGAIFFIFSSQVISNKKYGVFLLFVTVISISINATNNDLHVNTALNLMIAYFAVYLVYFFIVIKPLYRMLHAPKKIKSINKDDYLKLLMLSNGYTFKEVCKAIGENPKTYDLEASVKELMRKSKCTNLIQLGKTFGLAEDINIK